MDNITELFERADQETKKGNFQKAIEYYEKIISLSSDDSRANHIANWGIGEIYLNNKQYDKAKYYLSISVKLAPNESIYHYLLGCTHTYTNEIDDAIYHLEKAVSLDDSKDIYWDQLGWVYGYNRDINKGIEYIKKSLNLNPQNTKSLRDICMLYAKTYKWSEALVCIEEAQKHDSNNEEILMIKKDLEYFQNEYERLSNH